MRFRISRLVAVLLFVPTLGFAQDPPNGGDQQKPPAAVGEEEAKPTRGFVSALLHNLGDDVKHLPRANSVYWLAGGAAGALAVHPIDDELNRQLVGGPSDGVFTAGKVIGAAPTLLAAGATAYIVGRWRGMRRLQHLGLDEIEAIALSEGLIEGAKVMVRRERPINPDGTPQTGSFSFPSGHASDTFAAATVLQQHLGYRAAIPTYIVASYVAMSRLHDNRHFASDVVFGAAVGIVVGRSVTWHGRNFYATPSFVPGGAAIMFASRATNGPAASQ